MNPDTYQALAARTECDQHLSRERMAYTTIRGDLTIPIRVNHAIVGMSGEVGELAAALQRWIYYGKPLDEVNIKEELGDLLWYVAECANALGFSMENIMEANILKLRKRYPAKYSDYLADEENRDLVAERETVQNAAR